MNKALEEAIAARLAAEPQVSLGIIFGSMASSTEHFGSDLDLAVAGRHAFAVHGSWFR